MKWKNYLIESTIASKGMYLNKFRKLIITIAEVLIFE